MLDEKGFVRPTYDEIVQQESAKWVQLFGENAQTSAHSVGGILIRIHSYFMDKENSPLRVPRIISADWITS